MPERDHLDDSAAGPPRRRAFATTVSIAITNIQRFSDHITATLTPTPRTCPTVAGIAEDANHLNDPNYQFSGSRTAGTFDFTFSGLQSDTSYVLHAFAVDSNQDVGHTSMVTSTTSSAIVADHRREIPAYSEGE